MKNLLQKTEKILNDNGYEVQVEVNDSYCSIDLNDIEIRALDRQTYVVDVYDDEKLDKWEVIDTKVFRTQKQVLDYLINNKYIFLENDND